MDRRDDWREPWLNRNCIQSCFTSAPREGPAGGARFHNEDQPPPNSCVRFPFTSEKPRTTAPVARLFQRPAGGYASSHGATSSQAPRTTFTRRNARETSHIAMVARLATMGPMIRSFARAGSAYPSTAGDIINQMPARAGSKCFHMISEPAGGPLRARPQSPKHTPERHALVRGPLQVLEARQEFIHRRPDHHQ